MPADPVSHEPTTSDQRPTATEGHSPTATDNSRTTVDNSGATATDNSGATADDRRATSVDRLTERLDAVERALTESDRSVDSIADAAAAADARASLADRLSAVEARIDELEAATQAVRGYTGAVRAVNRDVERRADLALARATAAHDGYAADREEALTDGDRPPESGTRVDESALAAAVPPDDPHTGTAAISGESARDASTGDDAESVTSRALERLRERV